MDSVGLKIFLEFCILVVGVILVLDDSGRDFGITGDVFVLFRGVVVRDSDGADFAGFHSAFESFVEVFIAAARLMNQHEVNILQAKCVIGLVNQSVIVSFSAGNDFAGDEDIFTGDYAFSDSAPDSAPYT